VEMINFSWIAGLTIAFPPSPAGLVSPYLRPAAGGAGSPSNIFAHWLDRPRLLPHRASSAGSTTPTSASPRTWRQLGLYTIDAPAGAWIDAVATLISFLFILWQLSGSLSLGLSSASTPNVPGYMVWVALVYAFVGNLARQHGRSPADPRSTSPRAGARGPIFPLLPGCGSWRREMPKAIAPFYPRASPPNRRNLVGALPGGVHERLARASTTSPAARLLPDRLRPESPSSSPISWNRAPRFLSPAPITLGRHDAGRRQALRGQVPDGAFPSSSTKLCHPWPSCARVMDRLIGLQGAHRPSAGTRRIDVAPRDRPPARCRRRRVSRFGLPNGSGAAPATRTLVLPHGRSTLITGRPAASGKSTLFPRPGRHLAVRAMARCACPGGGARVLFLPQKTLHPDRHPCADAVEVSRRTFPRRATPRSQPPSRAARLGQSERPLERNVAHWTYTLSGVASSSGSRVGARPWCSSPNWLFLDEADGRRFDEATEGRGFIAS